MTRDEMIDALKQRFPVNNPASWVRLSEKCLRESCEEYAILSEAERKHGVISVGCMFTGKWEKMYPRGKGAYPYSAGQTHPDAMVYEDEKKVCWTTMVDYQELRPSYFIHKTSRNPVLFLQDRFGEIE